MRPAKLFVDLRTTKGKLMALMIIEEKWVAFAKQQFRGANVWRTNTVAVAMHINDFAVCVACLPHSQAPFRNPRMNQVV